MHFPCFAKNFKLSDKPKSSFWIVSKLNWQSEKQIKCLHITLDCVYWLNAGCNLYTNPGKWHDQSYPRIYRICLYTDQITASLSGKGGEGNMTYYICFTIWLLATILDNIYSQVCSSSNQDKKLSGYCKYTQNQK